MKYKSPHSSMLYLKCTVIKCMIIFPTFCKLTIYNLNQLEQLERLRSEDTPRRLMITHTIESCWIPSQN